MSPPPDTPLHAAPLRLRLEEALPQTQCRRCGYADCGAYAQAMADGQAAINRCPPGGAEGIVRLAAITGAPLLPLDPDCGREGRRALAVIDEAWCIGCKLCIKACPVDCIVGGPKLMHSVVADLCTGCELCVPVCPVDCITMLPSAEGTTGWDAWSERQADESRQRYAFHLLRHERDQREEAQRLAAKAQARLHDLQGQSRHTDPAILAAKRAVIEAALKRSGAGAAAPDDESTES